MASERPHTNRIVLEATRAVLVECIAQIDAQLAAGEGAPAQEILAPPPEDRSAFARAAGFTGDICRHCSGVSMRRSGVCLTCNDCGSTTGCS